MIAGRLAVGAAVAVGEGIGVGVKVWVMVGDGVGAAVRVGKGVSVGCGVAVGASLDGTAACRVGPQPASRPASAASLMNSRRGISCGRELGPSLDASVIDLSFPSNL
jgi:hypothetical protein